jgi:hypothetical protein
MVDSSVPPRMREPYRLAAPRKGGGLHEAAVGRADGELGRLGHDGGVDGGAGQVPEHLLDAQAGVLLVGDGGHHDLSGDSGGRRVPLGNERRS